MKRLEWISSSGLCLLVLPLQGGIKLLHKFAIDHGAGCVPYGDLILSGINPLWHD